VCWRWQIRYETPTGGDCLAGAAWQSSSLVWDKPNPQRAVIKASQVIRCDLLALLAEADVRGRQCDDQLELLERVQFFREFCQENNCLFYSRPFPSDHSRFVYFQKDNRDPNYAALMTLDSMLS
jgi:hypothetical protein